MYYAIIIIVALAIAFIIIIRRLPEAADSQEQERNSAKGFSFPQIKMPIIQLPQMPKRPPAARAPITPPVPAPTQTIHAVPTPGPIKPQNSFTFPKLSIPKFLQSAPKQTTPPVQTREERTAQDDDFWRELKAQTKPVAEPYRQPVAPSSSEAQAKSKPRGKDLFQEAEDLFAIKDYRKAEKLYLRLAADDPKNPKIYSRLGIIYLEQKNHEDARDALQQALKLEPNVASRHFNLALVYLSLGSPSKAIASMESALKYDPSNRKYRKMLDDILAGRA